MSKYTRKQAIRIAQLIEEDEYTVTEICHMNRISRKTFYQWKETKPEFKEMIELAEEIRDEKLLHLARTSLKKKLEGYTLTEEKITYVPDKNDPSRLVIKHKVVKTKHYPPDNRAIKTVLTREEKAKSSIEENTEESRKEQTEIRRQDKLDKLNFLFTKAMLLGGLPPDRWDRYRSYARLDGSRPVNYQKE